MIKIPILGKLTFKIELFFHDLEIAKNVLNISSLVMLIFECDLFLSVLKVSHSLISYLK